MNSIVVSTHVGRDLLQAATAFKTADIAVWEYIVNSLQYLDHGISPVVTIDINHRKKTITINDNGRGMDLNGLNNFFKMHAKNIDRQHGKKGRGKFGTGKSAAFGIAKKLTVESTFNKKRNTVTLHRQDIENSDGGVISVNIIENNIVAEDKIHGTTIKIEEIFLKKIDTTKIIKKIEKHLQSFRHSNPQVLVGDHICEYKEPDYSEVMVFRPESKLEEVLGSVELIVKISNMPLNIDERGILVSCGTGNLVALEDAGVCSKEMGEYIFGEIDVENLESDQYEVDAYDISRDMKLRPEHPVVIALNMFLGTNLEKVRKQLVQKKRDAMKTEESKKLKEQGDKIAELLNNDFKEINDKILQIRSTTSNIGKLSSRFGDSLESDDNEDGWISGIEERGNIEQTDRNPDSDNIPNDHPPRIDPEISKAGEKNIDGNASVDPIGDSQYNKKHKRPRGGFSVEYKNMGIDQDRAIYTSDKGVFTVNLDHPLVKSAANNLGIHDIGFRRLSHEIIFAEYSLALANMAAVDDPDIPADDVIYDARETLNRISAKSAALYEAS